MVIVIKKEKLILFVLILTAFLILAPLGFSYIDANLQNSNKKVIVVDPGHGGRDPGAVGNSGMVEKNINLEISKKLKKLLEKNGYNVILTRKKDVSLHDKGVSNKKRSDIKNRKKIIKKHNPEILISIHLNSFQQQKYYGAQVFYSGGSTKSKKLGELVQQELRNYVDSKNKRQAKSINNILLIKNLDVPSVIVECGFLSNPKEEKLLNTDEHQQKIARAILSGIIKYFSLQQEEDNDLDKQNDQNAFKI